jgi:hypothetical protein
MFGGEVKGSRQPGIGKTPISGRFLIQPLLRGIRRVCGRAMRYIAVRRGRLSIYNGLEENEEGA